MKATIEEIYGVGTFGNTVGEDIANLVVMINKTGLKKQDVKETIEYGMKQHWEAVE